MCAKFGCGPTVVSKKRGVQTDKGTLQLYIVDNNNVKTIILNTNHTEHLGWSRDGFSPRKKIL